MKLIDLHNEWMKNGELPDLGLCNSIPFKYRSTFNLFRPLVENIFAAHGNYWGHGNLNIESLYNIAHEYTPLRQTIVLTICAMHNEI